MRSFIFNTLKLQSQNVNEWVAYGLVATWLAILVITALSIASQRIKWQWKVVWLVTILSLPIVGVFLYLIYCLTKADFAFLVRLGLRSPIDR